jgi:hypothetical protein
MSATRHCGPSASAHRQMEERDLYQLLQVDPLASQEIIGEAYWLLVRKAQSLRRREGASSETLEELNAAYATLVNSELRRSYNRILPLARLDGSQRASEVILARRSLLQRLLGRLPSPVSTKGKNLYRILRVDPGAEQQIIAAANACLRRHYTERIWSGEGGEEALDELTEAFSILGDPERRARYDADLAGPHELEPKPRPKRRSGRSLRRLVHLLRQLSAWTGRATYFISAHLYRGARWVVITVLAPAAHGLTSAGVGSVHALLRRQGLRPEPLPSDDIDSAVRERLHVNIAPSVQTVSAATSPQSSASSGIVPARLVICSGPNAGSTFVLTDRPISLGADPECDVILEGPAGEIAPVQARIWYREGRYMIHKVADSVKIVVGGRPLTWAILEDGDELRIGGHQLTFELKSLNEATRVARATGNAGDEIP